MWWVLNFCTFCIFVIEIVCSFMQRFNTSLILSLMIMDLVMSRDLSRQIWTPLLLFPLVHYLDGPPPPPCMSTITEIQEGQGLGSGYKWLARLVSRVCMAGLVVFRVCVGAQNNITWQILQEFRQISRGGKKSTCKARFEPVTFSSTHKSTRLQLLSLLAMVST